MALTHWGFIYTAAGSAAGGEVNVVETGKCRTVLVGLEKPEEAIEVARRLVGEGVQLIELCGGFGPVWAGRIIEAIDGAVPVGTVGYGPEAVNQVQALFS
jgi:2-keto-3-deoxy-6-phosphogluconate aldolase